MIVYRNAPKHLTIAKAIMTKIINFHEVSSSALNNFNSSRLIKINLTIKIEKNIFIILLIIIN